MSKARSYHYQSNLSSSYQPNNAPFRFYDFQNFSALGYLSQENFTIGSLTITNQTFGEVTGLYNEDNPSILYYDASLIYIFCLFYIFEFVVKLIFLLRDTWACLLIVKF